MEQDKITDIHCPNCGAPAAYDIRRRIYVCRYCGGEVTVDGAIMEKQGFRKLRQKALKEEAPHFHLLQASCSGCGARILFEEGEALANCAFCGRALVRNEYMLDEDLPESVIPFRITEEEAKSRMEEWCAANRNKKEAKLLKQKSDSLKGFYLPYEFVRGPIGCEVSRYSGGGTHSCEGFIDEVFVNASHQLDNLLLDGVEPFDLSELTPFEFAYVAGHRVKTADVSGEELQRRISREVGEAYAPAVRKVLESKAVHVDADVSSVVRMPALLPVYYVSDGDLMAAVSGQTGKVSVRALKESHYYFLPWWLKAILSTVLLTLVVFAGLLLFGAEAQMALILSGMLGVFFLIVTLVEYSYTDRLAFRVESGRKIFTSGKKETAKASSQRNITPPVFYETIDGKKQEVVLRFSAPMRIAESLLLALFVLFLPVIIALFLNGFQFNKLELGGSAVWFCIVVPVIPIYLLKFESVERYDRPWIYIVKEDGRKVRYRKPLPPIDWKETILTILRLCFLPPICFAVWFGIASFFVMCYLTAFGF